MTSVTMAEVARIAGVSLKTVSRVVNGEAGVRPQVVEQVRRALDATGYRRNEVARSLATGTTQTIALVVPNLSNPFYPALVEGAQLEADKYGYSVLLCATQRNRMREDRYFNLLSTRRVDGAVLVNLGAAAERLRDLEVRGIPVVTALDAGRTVNHKTHVAFDHRDASRKVVQLLLARNHVAVAHIAGRADLAAAKLARLGYRDALRSTGVPFRPELVAPGNFTESAGWDAVQALLDHGVTFTAISAANDLMAIGALAALRDRGIRVPDDVSVTGIDDINLARYTTPALTTIRQPAFEIGRCSAQRMLARLGNRPPDSEASTKLVGEVIVRESVGPAPRSASARARRPAGPTGVAVPLASGKRRSTPQ